MVANMVLQSFQVMFYTTFGIIALGLLSYGIQLPIPILKIPSDVHTAYQRYFVKPMFKCTPCCPSCFSLYNSATMPEICPWRASPLSWPCNEELWRTRRTSKGPKRIPRCLYTTQDIDEWLQYFLSRTIIDDTLQETYRRMTNVTPVTGSEIHEVQDSKGYRDMYSGDEDPYNLHFAVFIDWFCVYKMKIAGTRHTYTISIALLIEHHREEGIGRGSCTVLLESAKRASL